MPDHTALKKSHTTLQSSDGRLEYSTFTSLFMNASVMWVGVLDLQLFPLLIICQLLKPLAPELS
jgi:hypothetical protein